MKFTKKLLATLLCAVMLVTAVVSTGITTGMEAEALNAVGTSTEFQLTKANYTFGCDISSYNVLGETLAYSRVDFAKMKADGCDFVILRIGQTKSKDHKQYIDMAFLEYYKRARAAGMKLGVYFYSRARTAAEAKKEANWVINIIESNNMYFEYPIYFDVESQEQFGGTNPSGTYYNALSTSALETMTKSFMDTMEAAGYFPALYCMKSAFADNYTSSFLAKYDLWGAHVKNGEGTAEADLKYEDPYEYDYSTSWGMWQYSWYGHKKFNGYTYDSKYKQLDVNICYKDYPSLMTKYGYNNCAVATTDGNIAQGATVTTFEVVNGARANINVTTRGYAANLTDGVYSQEAPKFGEDGAEKGTWFAFFKNDQAVDKPETSYFDGENCSSGLGHIMINLGSAKTIGCVKAYVSGTEGTAPGAIKVFAGTSEYALTEIGTMTLPAGGYGFATLNIPATVSAQYVRLDVTVNGYWALLNEVQMFAKPEEGSGTTTPSEPTVEDCTHNAIGAPVSDTYNTAPLVSASSGCKFGTTSILTDGKVSNGVSAKNSSWYTIQRFWNCDNEETGVGELTLDLGGSYAIEAVKLHLANTQMAAPTAGYFVTAPAPASIKVTLLDENKATVASGSIATKSDAEIVYWSDAYAAKGAVARYVVLNITVGGTVDTALYALLDEIAVFGTVVDDNNIALGQTVTSVPTATRGYSASLTDGKAANIFSPGVNNADWYAFFTNADATDENCPTGVGDVIIDLGKVYDLTEVKVHIGTCDGVYAPVSVVASVATTEDGTYKEIGALKGEAEADGTYWVSVDATGAKGRYLKITVTVDTESEWSYYAAFNEVKAYGTESTASDRLRGDVNNDGVIDKKDYAALKRYCFNTITLDDESVLAADVNNDGEVDKKDYASLKRHCFNTWTIETPYI